MKTFKLIMLFILVLGGCTKEELLFNEKLMSGNSKCASEGKKRIVNKLVENIHWIQQSCFRIDGLHTKIYTDPLSITKTDEADIILITHAHGDHFSQADIDKLTGPNTIVIAPEDCQYTGTAKRIVLKPGEVFCFRDTKIKAVPAYNIIKTWFHPVENDWVGYVITMNGVSIYDFGDTERIPELQEINCDIAIVPLGQTYTMNSVEEAVQSVIDVRAMVAIPMHYGLYEGTNEDAIAFKTLLSDTV